MVITTIIKILTITIKIHGNYNEHNNEKQFYYYQTVHLINEK